ncbi:hypothetical protein EYC56_00445 [Xanthomonas oryzae]|nr:hypothetical protein EYC56_00445 [Xanthomonas oryzae]
MQRRMHAHSRYVGAGSDTAGGVSRGNVAQVIAAVLATLASIGKTLGVIDGQTPIPPAMSQLE